MLFVIPVHPTVPRIEHLADDFKRHGKLDNHVLRLISRREDEGLAYTIGDKLSDHFRSVTTQALSDKKRTPMELNNDLFKAAFMFAREYKSGPDEFPDHPLCYFDPAYRPIKTGWADTIQAEFFMKQAVTMGRTTTGKEPKSRLYIGPVILGRKFFSNLEVLGFLDPGIPWRERLIWQLMQGSVETKFVGSGNKSLVRKVPDSET